MSNQFGGPAYTSPETRELSSITESPNPDAADFASADKMAALLQRHDFQIKALAQGQQQLQQGVNDATNNPIQQIQQFIADVIVLLGGGEITEGVLDFGDLQYILPTLGALFGLGDAPFPVDLFQAAERFFFGYVVPNQQFTDEINTIIKNWLSLIGIDPQFIKDLQDLTTAIGTLFGSVGNLLPSLTQLFEALGIDANDLGPLGQLLGPIIKFFSGLDLKKIGTLLEFVTDALDPIVKDLTAVINFINAVLAVLGFEEHGGGGVVNSPLPELTTPFENLMKFLGGIKLGSPDFNPVEAAYQFIDNVLKPTGLIVTAQQIAAAISGLTGTDINLDDVSTFFTNLRKFLGGMNLNDGSFNPVAGAEQFIRQVLSRTGLVLGPNSPISIGAITTNQPNLLIAPLFAADAVGPNPDWVVDPASSRSADGTGSVMVVADGRFKALRSGSDPTDTIKVGAGQKITASIWVSHQRYMAAGTGAPVVLQVVPFTSASDGSLVRGDFVTLDSFTPSGTADLGWPGHQLTGSYTVPDGVIGIQIRLLVTDTAQAGIFRFDDGSVTQAAVVPKSWVEGLEDDLQFASQRWQSLADTIASAASKVPVVGAELSDVMTALENFDPTNILGPLGSVNMAGDLQAVLNAIVGGHLGKPVTNASVADLYNAINQSANNVPGSDETFYLTTSQTISIPAYAQYIDVVVLGPGQGGEQGLTLGFFGQGGAPGKYNATTWQRGTHFDNTVTTVNFVQGTPGAANGGVGTAPTVSITGHSLSSTPGSGPESPVFLGGSKGIGPGGFDYNGKHYAGGGDQNTPGAAGSSPGGGGAGGNGIFFQPGGPGGAPAAWVRFRANAVANQSTGADTTPPSAPTTHVVAATNSSLTLSATGSVDA